MAINVKPKRRFRKRVYRRRGQKRVTSKKGVTRIVKKVLHSQIENKRAFFRDATYITPQMDVVNCYKVIPTIYNGSKQAERIGNLVKPISLRLGISASMRTAPNPITDVDMGRTGVYFDLYVFKVVSKPSYSNLVTSADLDTFLQGGNGSNRYVAEAINWHQNVNKEKFICLHRSRRLMNSMGSKAGSPDLVFESWGQNTNSAFSIDIPLSKKLKTKLKFNDSDGVPTNCAIYACIVATRADNIQFDDPYYAIGTVDYFSELVYEDA